MCDVFSFFEFKACTCSFVKKNTKPADQLFFFMKMFLLYEDTVEIICKNQSNFQKPVVWKLTFRQF